MATVTHGADSRRLVGLAVATVLLIFSTSAHGHPAAQHDSACALFRPGAETVNASDCLACHQAGRGGPIMRGTHPVGLDYAGAQLANPGLRPGAEVVRRGILLPDGKIQCVTCHDAASPWAKHIALPPGSVPSPAVNPRDAHTYEREKSWRLAGRRDPLPPVGSAVTPSPLCAACHTLAD